MKRNILLITESDYAGPVVGSFCQRGVFFLNNGFRLFVLNDSPMDMDWTDPKIYAAYQPFSMEWIYRREGEAELETPDALGLHIEIVRDSGISMQAIGFTYKDAVIIFKGLVQRISDQVSVLVNQKGLTVYEVDCLIKRIDPSCIVSVVEVQGSAVVTTRLEHAESFTASRAILTLCLLNDVVEHLMHIIRVTGFDVQPVANMFIKIAQDCHIEKCAFIDNSQRWVKEYHDQGIEQVPSPDQVQGDGCEVRGE